MKIVEYKRHLVNGVVQDPEFIIDGGKFFDPQTKTWVGKVLDENDRTYYIPDTLIELTKDELIARCVSLKYTKLSNPSDPHSQFVNLALEEIKSLVNSWVGDI